METPPVPDGYSSCQASNREGYQPRSRLLASVLQAKVVKLWAIARLIRHILCLFLVRTSVSLLVQ